jgi:hypothetical protein
MGKIDVKLALFPWQDASGYDSVISNSIKKLGTDRKLASQRFNATKFKKLTITFSDMNLEIEGY